MKPFNSSVLSIKEYSSSKQLLETVQEKKSPLVSFLEFDESIAQSELDSTRNYYLSLLKLSNNPTPKESNAVCDAIFNHYEAVKTAINGYFYTDSYQEYDNIYTKLRDFEKNVECKVASLNKMIPIYSIGGRYITIPSNGIIRYPVNEYCKKVLEAIKSRNIDSIKGYNNLGEEMYSHLGKLFLNTDDIDNIDTFVDHYSKIFRSIKENETYGINSLNTARTALDNISSYRVNDSYNIDIGSGADALINALKVNIDLFEDPNDLRMIIQNICNTMVAYVLIYAKCNTLCLDVMRKVTNANISNIMHAIEEENDSFHESLSMFGDKPIDSSNIFDLLDGDEFNNSYYMDLSLIADHEAAMDKIRIQKEALIQEAIMITEGNYDQAIIEAGIGSKIRDGFKKIVEFLRNMVKKFVESIRFNFGKEKEWLQKYRNIILNNSFDPGTKVAFYCNYENAIKLIKGVVPPAISYAQLKQKPAAFENEEAFMNEYFKTLKNAIDNDEVCKEKSNDTLANKVKWCLGAKWPDGKTKEVNFSELNIADMYNWLLSTIELAKATENQVKTIEQTVANYDKQAAALGVKQDNAGQQATKESSIFGITVGQLITEADVNVQSSENNNGDAKTPAAGGTVKPVDNNNPNAKDQQQNQGQAKEEIQNSGDDPSLVAGRMQIYLNVCKAVLSAKATAITYAHKEMLDVMRAIVKAKLGNSADLKLRNQNPNGETQQPTQEQPAQ